MSELFDTILELVIPPCFPELIDPCRVCGERLYHISQNFPAQCINEDCTEGAPLDILRAHEADMNEYASWLFAE
jgi:hypothetical protein